MYIKVFWSKLQVQKGNQVSFRKFPKKGQNQGLTKFEGGGAKWHPTICHIIFGIKSS